MVISSNCRGPQDTFPGDSKADLGEAQIARFLEYLVLKRKVYLPEALARKYPNAEKEFRWQYVFPSSNLES